MGDLTCTRCNGPVDIRPVSFIKDGKLWRVSVFVCTNEKCLLERGATFSEHRAERRLESGQM